MNFMNWFMMLRSESNRIHQTGSFDRLVGNGHGSLYSLLYLTIWLSGTSLCLGKHVGRWEPGRVDTRLAKHDQTRDTRGQSFQIFKLGRQWVDIYLYIYICMTCTYLYICMIYWPAFMIVEKVVLYIFASFYTTVTPPTFTTGLNWDSWKNS